MTAPLARLVSDPGAPGDATIRLYGHRLIEGNAEMFRQLADELNDIASILDAAELARQDAITVEHALDTRAALERMGRQ